MIRLNIDMFVKDGDLTFEANCLICNKKHSIKAKIKNSKFVSPLPPGEYKCDRCNNSFYIEYKLKEEA